MRALEQIQNNLSRVGHNTAPSSFNKLIQNFIFTTFFRSSAFIRRPSSGVERQCRKRSVSLHCRRGKEQIRLLPIPNRAFSTLRESDWVLRRKSGSSPEQNIPCLCFRACFLWDRGPLMLLCLWWTAAMLLSPGARSN